MRRKTDKDILTENSWLIIGSSLLILLGIFLVIFPFIAPVVSYDSLQTKKVTITAFKHHYGGGGSSYDYIQTTDGEEYNISGAYEQKQLKELLTEGKAVTIKWYQNKPFWTLLAEEIYVDGKRVVRYDNDLPVDWKTPFLFGSCSVAFGIGGFLTLRLFLRTNRRKQKKRDEKILRKYGSLKK